MEKNELKYVAPYLPFGVKFISDLDKPYDDSGNQPIWTCDGITKLFGDYCLSTEENNDAYPILNCKLLLRPLSDLIKDEFTLPLINLLIERRHYKSVYADGFDSYSSRVIKKPFGYIFKIQNHDDWVLLISLNEPDRVKAYVFNWLLENRFDVFGLIEKGQAINLNEINKLKP